MQVSVEKTSELSRKMTVNVPETVIQEKIAERLKTLAREVKVDGFRPGKVPQHIVKKMYGDRIRNEISGDLIQSTYYEALQNNQLKPAGNPFIDSLDESEGFSYTAIFEVYPEISLEGLEQMEVVRTLSKVEETDVDQMIERLRTQKQTWQAVERAAQQNDRVTINFSGTANDETFTDGLIENYQVEIGSEQMIPGFEDNLIGLETGAEKTFTLTFPEQYANNPKLAGSPAEISVTVITIEEPVLPQVDEEFIKSYGIEDGLFDSFREDVQANMTRELNQVLQNLLKNSVMDALYGKIACTVPTALVDEEVERLMKPYLETAKRRNLNTEDLPISRDNFAEQAKRRVALGLILGEVIHQNNITLDAKKARESIEDMAKSYEKPEDVVTWYYADKSRLNDVQQMVLENQTVEWLVAHAKVTEQTVPFNDVMSQQQ